MSPSHRFQLLPQQMGCEEMLGNGGWYSMDACVCAPLGMSKVSETEGLSGSRVLILSGLLEGLPSASPVPSPEQTQGWAFRVCLDGKAASKGRGQEEPSDRSACPFLVPPSPHPAHNSCLRPWWAAELPTPALDLVLNGVVALRHGVWVLGTWLYPVNLFSAHPSPSHRAP